MNRTPSLALLKYPEFVARLVELAGVRAPDRAEADVAEWVAQWLEEPLSELGGERPYVFLNTPDGRQFVENVLRHTDIDLGAGRSSQTIHT